MKRLILLFISIQSFFFAFAQESSQVKGTVYSSDGETLIGVTVTVEGKATGTITDMDGVYHIAAKPGDKLSFTYLGYKKETVSVKGSVVNITLVPDHTSLEEVLVVGYGQVKRITMTGSVSGISAKDIRTVPTANVQNTLSGRLPGFFSQQSSGQPGKDASDFFIRGISSLNNSNDDNGKYNGNRPLIIVDDVQYSYDQLQQINVNEIESISILKDASTTAIYGIKGANGVLVVKTRRGTTGTPQINLRLESGIAMPVRTPKFLNSYTTANLVNEAYQNDGLNLPFTQNDLELFRNGQDPYGHPNVNWYNEIFKKYSFQENANLDIGGGSEKVKYFITGGYFTQNGLVRNFEDPHGELNTNYFYRRFNLRTNLDFQISKTLSMRLDMNTRFMNINEPGNFNAVGEIYDFSKMRPYSAPVINPNGTYAYHYNMPNSETELPTLNARLANEGYKRTRRYDSNILYSANQKLDFITQGLYAVVQVAYSSVDENQRKMSRGADQYPSYHYNSQTNIYNINPRNNKTYAYSPYNISGSNVNDIVSRYNSDISARLNYGRTFNSNHIISGMLMYNRQSATDKKDVPANFESFTLSASYNYKNKYLADFNMAYNGTDRFGKDNRYGFFPAGGVAYNIAEEDFFREKFSRIQMLKLRASLGIVGSDVAPGGRYIYKQVYEHGVDDRYYFAEEKDSNGDANNAYHEGALGNNNVTWEKNRKLNLAVDANFLDKFSLTFEAFFDYRYDQLVEKENVSLILGQKLPPTNSGETQNRGFDGQFGYQDKFGEVAFNTNFVFSFAKNKILYMAEPDVRYPWLYKTGRSIGQPFGYRFDGYYTQEDIATIEAEKNSVVKTVPVPEIPVQAGDLKYKDLNGDGVIDDYDKSPVGKPNLPTTNLGLTIGAMYKGFSISVLFQGAFDYSFDVVGTGIESFKSQFQPVHEKRWTQERFEKGLPVDFPRLTTLPSTINSSGAYPSDYWLVNAFYVRLKTIDFSYLVPTKALPSKYISSLRFYANAYNLFTYTNYSKYQQDPEIKTNTAGDAYMNQRVINLGVQMSF